jgi:thiamine biosynthesis protein ThiS
VLEVGFYEANGKRKGNEIQSAVSIYEFLEQKGIKPATVVVEHNYEIPDRGAEGSIAKRRDNLEIIKFMGGG